MNDFTFGDVLYKPKYSDIVSRSEVDITSDLGRFKLRLPMISANMKDITGPKMAIEMAKHGGLGILHRFNSTEEAVAEFKEAIAGIEALDGDDPNMVNPNSEYMPFVGVSIGVQERDKERFDALFSAGARIFCIDIAHGHHVLMKKMIEFIREREGEAPYIISGNIATPEAYVDMVDWGTSCVKVGIGPGSMCATRQNTGVGVPQLSALCRIFDAAKWNSTKRNVKIIADGGIKSNGDIGKALKYADAVMVGSFIAGTSETPGMVFENAKGEYYKVFGGSASAENKVNAKAANAHVEGVMSTVPLRGHVKYILRKTHQNLQSCFSYSGARNLKELREKSEFVFLTGSGKQESKL